MLKDLLQHESVRDFLFDGAIYDRLEEIADKYQLPRERTEELLDLSDAVLDGKAQLEQMPQMIAQAFGIDEAAARGVAADIAGYRLLALDAYIGGVAEAIAGWGGDASAYPVTRLVREEVKSDTIAQRVLKERGVELPAELLQRYQYLADQYLSGAQSHAAMLIFLQRDTTIGGLALSHEAAENLLDALGEQRKEAHAEIGVEAPELKKNAPPIEKEELLAMLAELEAEDVVVSPPPVSPKPIHQSLPARPIKVDDAAVPMSKEELVETLAELDADAGALQSRSASAAQSALRAVLPSTGGDVMNDAEREELAQHRARVESRGRKVGGVNDIDAVLQESLAPIVSIARKYRALKREVLMDVARKHVKGVRDARHTEALLISRYKVSESDAEQIVAAFERAKRRVHGSEMIKSPARSARTRYDGNNVASKDIDVLNKRHAVLTKRVADSRVDSVLPHARVSAARTKEQELALQESKLDAARLQAAQTASRPKRATAKLSAPSSPPRDASGRLTDVKFQKRLMGPVDELGTMAPADFRRLSSDPVEAGKKAEDMMDRLRDENYEMYIAGVMAWRKNPINQLYRLMARQAIERGVSLAEIATDRRNRGEESLTAAEIKSLMQVNARVKF